MLYFEYVDKSIEIISFENITSIAQKEIVHMYASLLVILSCHVICILDCTGRYHLLPSRVANGRRFMMLHAQPPLLIALPLGCRFL